MESIKQIKYYRGINGTELNKLQLWFMEFIKKNKRELLYESIPLVEYLNYKILMSMEMNSTIYFYLYREDKKISLEFVLGKEYKNCDKSFMNLLLMLKKIVKENIQ